MTIICGCDPDVVECSAINIAILKLITVRTTTRPKGDRFLTRTTPKSSLKSYRKCKQDELRACWVETLEFVWSITPTLGEVPLPLGDFAAGKEVFIHVDTIQKLYGSKKSTQWMHACLVFSQSRKYVIVSFFCKFWVIYFRFYLGVFVNHPFILKFSEACDFP